MFEISADENLPQNANETSRMACAFDPGRTMYLMTSVCAWRIDHSQLQNAKPDHGCSMTAAIKVQAPPLPVLGRSAMVRSLRRPGALPLLLASTSERASKEVTLNFNAQSAESNSIQNLSKVHLCTT